MKKIILFTLLSLGLISHATLSYSDTIVLDDLVIKDDLCVGLFCRSGNIFLYDTIQAKHFVVGMYMQDTSSSARFPSSDWSFKFNDSQNGGANYFQLRDIDNNLSPMRINGGAPSNSLYIEKNALHGFREIGLGTSTPQTMLHLTSSNTPSIYFEQTNVGKWPAYAWSMGANSNYFFWQDVTSGNTQPVKIFEAAVANSLRLTNQGRVGIGTDSPSSQLHVVGYGAVARVNNTLTYAQSSELLRLQNATGTYITFSESGMPPTPTVTSWNMGSLKGHIVFNDLTDASPGKEFRIFSTGRAVILGTLTSRDSTSTEETRGVDSQLLTKNFMKLPIHKWLSELTEGLENSKNLGRSEGSKGAEEKVSNLSPDPQAFHKLFGLGLGEKYISSSDLDALNVAVLKTIDSEHEKQFKALKAQEAKLKKLWDAQDQEIAGLKDRLKNFKQAQSGHLLVKAGGTHDAN